MCSSHAARERNISSITHVSGSSWGWTRCMNTQPGSLRVFCRIDCSCASASSSRSSRGLMVTTRNRGPSWSLMSHYLPLEDRHRTSSSSRNGNRDGVLQRVDEGLRVLTLHERRHRVIERLLEGGWHEFAVRHRQQNFVVPQCLGRLPLISG